MSNLISNDQRPTTKDYIYISSLNHYEYCPTRCYWIYVAGEFKDNEYTVEGDIIHENVHKTMKTTRGDLVQLRKVHVYSRKYRLIGFADLIEEKAGEFYPVEYKRGRRGDWKNDKLQLCAQALCLEEMCSSTDEPSLVVSRWSLDKSQKTNDQRLKTGSEVWFRVTLLDDSVFPIFSLHFLENPNHTIRLGTIELLVKEVKVTGGKGAWWRGFSDYKKLYESAELSDEITLQFATPTSFKQGDINMLFPIPRLVFKGYLEKWNKYSSMEFDGSLLDRIEDSLIISSYDLNTLPFSDGRATIPGFIGISKFKIKSRDKELLKQINLLADFSFFAGAGRKTTHGMGMTRRVIGR